MVHSLKSVRRLLKDKPTLKYIQLELSAQQALLGEVRRLLPTDLAARCIAAQLRGPQLILHVESPVWATRMRFLSANLQSLLQPHHADLREIKVKSLPRRGAPRPRLDPARRSAAGARIVLESADDIEAPILREALRRLGRALQGDYDT